MKKKTTTIYFEENINVCIFYVAVLQRNKITFISVTHNVAGQLKTIQPLLLSDLNLCHMVDNVRKHYVQFGRNYEVKCRLNLMQIIQLMEVNPVLTDLYLNYTENNVNLLKAVPVLLRNSFAHNQVGIYNT